MKDMNACSVLTSHPSAGDGDDIGEPAGRGRQTAAFAGTAETREQEAQDRFERLFRGSPALTAIMAVADRRLVDVNDAFLATLGYARTEIIGKTGAEVGLYSHPAEVAKVADAALANGRISNFDVQLRRKDGATLDGLISVELVSIQGQTYFLMVVVDITQRKQAGLYQQLAVEILALLNESFGWAEAIGRILAAIKAATGFDAVGIRLQEADDFPYLVQDGFSQDFLITEDTLIMRDQHGLLCRDGQGKLRLECTCGMVLSGHQGAPNPLLTAGGSFWTNNALPLLEVAAKDDPRLHPRNRCIHLGYRSIALIPVRSSHTIVGLLQLNDRRKDCFTPETVRFFEGISASIGVALMRKQSVEALQAREEEWRGLFAVLPVGVSILDKHHAIKELNPALEAILGITQEGLQSNAYCRRKYCRPDGTAIPLEEFPSRRAELRQEIVRGVPIGVRKEDGTTVWTEVSAAPLHSPDSTCVLVTTDITPRVQAETELDENRRRLHFALDSASMGVWHIDLIKNWRHFDEETCRLLGLDPSCFRGTAQEFIDVVHPDDRDSVKAAFARSLEQGVPYQVEYRALWPDGSIHGISSRGHLVRNETGRPGQLDGIMWDQTELMRANKALHESQERFRQLAEIFPETIFEADLSARLTYANAHGLRKYGATQADLDSGINIASLIAPEDRPMALERLRRRFASKEGGYLEFRAVRLNGESFDALVYSAVILQQEKVVGIRGFILDISERKQAERELRGTNQLLAEATARANEMAAKAEAANQAKGEFLANMSHEIRTPMNGIIGMTGLLLETHLDAEQRRFAETVAASAESLLALINDILDFSKIEAGKLVLELIEFDLRAVFSDLSRAMLQRAAQKHLEFVCALPPDVPALLRGDPGRLRQVLTNLTANALKFTHEGSVEVCANLVQAGPHEAVLRFSVRDTGIGIAQDKLGILFRKFAQVDTSITRKYGGSGLGLVICKQLVELMGGEIGVTSEESRGSEFWFTARFEKQAIARVESSGAPVGRPALRDLRRSDVRILLAEDSITNQMVAVGILKRLGLHADVVASGKEAVEALRRIPYDLVLMDLQMPEMDGLEATRVVRAAGRETSAVPIIAMTAHAMPGDRQACLDAGMDDYIAKPLTPAALSALLEKWLAKLDASKRSEGTLSTSSPPPGLGSAAPAALFDEVALVERAVGDRELAQAIARSFLADVPGRMEALKGHVACGDAKAVQHQAHTIKGAAAVVGGEGVAQLALALERMGHAGDLMAAGPGLEALAAEFERLRLAMEASSLLATTEA